MYQVRCTLFDLYFVANFYYTFDVCFENITGVTDRKNICDVNNALSGINTKFAIVRTGHNSMILRLLWHGYNGHHMTMPFFFADVLVYYKLYVDRFARKILSKAINSLTTKKHTTKFSSANLKKKELKLYLIAKTKTRGQTVTVDLDEVAHYEPPHQDLHCLQIQLFSSLVLKELKL